MDMVTARERRTQCNLDIGGLPAERAVQGCAAS